MSSRPVYLESTFIFGLLEFNGPDNAIQIMSSRPVYLVTQSNFFLAAVAQLDARPTGDQEFAGSTPAEVGNIFSWRLIMKYFLLSFSPFRWFKKGSCQFLEKECAQYWLTA